MYDTAHSHSTRGIVPPGSLSSKFEQIIRTHGAQANSAFHPYGVSK